MDDDFTKLGPPKDWWSLQPCKVWATAPRALPLLCLYQVIQGCKNVVCSFVGAAMSRKLLARVVDLHDQPVGPASGTELQASAFDTLHDIYGQVGLDNRAVVSCTTLAHAAVTLSDSTRWPDLSASLDSLDEDCLTFGLPKCGVVVFTVGVKQRSVGEESVTATAGQQQSNGLVAVLAGGRRAYVRT